MTRACIKCGHLIEEAFLEHGRCHGCRVEYMEQKTFFIKDAGKNSAPPSESPRAVKRRANEEISWKLQRVLDKYGL